MTYPYTPAWFDYGARNGPLLGLMFHMAEGGGTVGYLDNKGNPPDRGVSVHTVCQYSGTVVQMLPWGHVSGSLNPADRSTDKAYYGKTHLQAVLGSYWTNPNVPVLSMEIEGFAKAGPNPAQVAGAIAWGLDMRQRFLTIHGALGHADQTDTKKCPGTTPAMRAIFDGVGGHGLWVPDTGVDTVNVFATPKSPTQVFVATGKVLYSSSALDPKDPARQVISPGRQMPYLGNPYPDVAMVERVTDKNVHTGEAWYMHPADVGAQSPILAADCTAETARADAAEALSANYHDRLTKINGLSAV